MSANLFSIVIASRNSKDDTKKCLASVYDLYEKDQVEVVVADNSSTDGTLEMIAESFPSVIVSRSSDTGCYASAINRGIGASTCDYILLLDSDAILQEETAPPLMLFLDAHPEAGIAASKMYYPDGTLQLTVKKIPTPINALFGRETFLTKLFPNNKISRQYLLTDKLNGTEPFDIDCTSSACIMLRRQVMEKSGLMDEGFLLYWADADFCYRVKETGWKIYLVPSSVVIHDMRNDAGKRKSYFVIKAFHQGVYRYYRKHFIKSPWHPMNLIALICLSVRAGLMLIQNQFIRCKE